MTPEDKKIYMNVYKRRLEWQKQEALNIQEYIDEANASNRPGEPDANRL